ncbi:hypothetical protein AUC68_01620 [Methyloceanibacter methanicus]|uniref:Uncharacterized protein n=1 Tax=Methyloceanibacter methanicus TaxID=1774968 RepID=A0A1E3W260_9HYPH|nr:hypothetical protein AUC68_01620 [Methyloceanibacter methanicus]
MGHTEREDVVGRPETSPVIPNPPSMYHETKLRSGGAMPPRQNAMTRAVSLCQRSWSTTA